MLLWIISGIGAVLVGWMSFRTARLAEVWSSVVRRLGFGVSAGPSHVPWLLDYGDADEDTVALTPAAITRLEAQNSSFVLVDEDEVQSPIESPWPRVSGEDGVAVGEGWLDIAPIALVTPERAGDIQLFPSVAESRKTSFT